ncbi:MULTISPECIES: hypothetical protein [unclassified Chryseobacterium]|uniref:hypothetical protein n=1 Tax=unclassified Chryseobacterium TaxID=2593645 RepID=UPI0022699029|nr:MULTISPECIES: hypothetical protein [unclassified Chryseobacterium]
MPIDFFHVPCTNHSGNCETENVRCLQIISNTIFGVSDLNANSRIPAKIMLDNEQDWDLKIENPNNRNIKYKAIDYCIDIFRTGNYDVNNDESDIVEFSSSNVDSVGNGLIKRCEGFLYEEGGSIIFFEIKTSPKGKWLIDARRKFEETILSFKEHHPDLAHLVVEPVVSNKSFYRVHQNASIQMRILQDKIGVPLRISTEIEVL